MDRFLSFKLKYLTVMVSRVLLASEDLQDQMASQERRVLPESVVAQVLRDPEE